MYVRTKTQPSMVGIAGCVLLLMLRLAGCGCEETVSALVEKEQPVASFWGGEASAERERAQLLTSFVSRLERPSVMGRRLHEKLYMLYSKEYFDSHVAEFDRFCWWIYDISYSVKTCGLRELVRDRMSRSAELDDAMRRLCSRGRCLFSSFPSRFESLFNRETDMSEWKILEETHDRIADRTAEIIGERYPTNLFKDGAFVRYRTHGDLREVIVGEAIGIVESMAGDPRLEELLRRMIAFTVEYCERMEE